MCCCVCPLLLVGCCVFRDGPWLLLVVFCALCVSCCSLFVACCVLLVVCVRCLLFVVRCCWLLFGWFDLCCRVLLLLFVGWGSVLFVVGVCCCCLMVVWYLLFGVLLAVWCLRLLDVRC